MARIRSLKPEFWSDEKLAKRVSRDARMLYLGLWNLADEHGRVRGSLHYLKSQVFMYDDDLTNDDVGRLVAELVAAERVQRYVVDDETYLHLPKLSKHQRLEPSKAESRHPKPPEIVQADPHPDDSLRGESERGDNLPGKSSSGMEHVAGSMLPVAGSMEQGSVSARDAETPAPKASTRGTRLAPDWQLPETWGQWAISEGLSGADVRREAAKFADFWHGKTGRDATKADWAGTWRNWIRRACESRAGPGKRSASSRVQDGLAKAAEAERQGR